MITVILVTIISTWLFGGVSSFLIPDIEKKIKKLVKDKVRLDAMLNALKTVKSVSKQLEKKQKGYKKQLNLLLADPCTSKKELKALFNASMEANRQFQDILINGRMVFVRNLTPDEFTVIIDPDAKATAKQEKKMAAPHKKINQEIDKCLGDISSVAIRHIEDTEKRHQATLALQEFKAAGGRIIEEHSKWNFRENAVLKNQKSSKAEFRKIADEINTLRTQMYTAFIDMYLQLSTASTEKEWKSASASLKKILK